MNTKHAAIPADPPSPVFLIPITLGFFLLGMDALDVIASGFGSSSKRLVMYLT